jgi:alpha-glucoside transport system permease protein
VKLLVILLTVGLGICGSVLVYFLLDLVASRLPARWRSRLQPFVFIGPVVIIMAAFQIYPTVKTLYLSVFVTSGSDGVFVGLQNYRDLFTQASFLDVLFNNLLWLLVVPRSTVLLGLAVAALAQRVSPLLERGVKALVFMPMAISFIAAATIWRFIYAYSPPGQPQVGLLNSLWVRATGNPPQAWLTIDSGHLNSLLLMVVVIWLNAGFAMVLLSAAIKGVPEDTVEQATLDGATDRQTFWYIVVPQIRTTIVAVLVTVLITVMKIFDIVFAMTGGAYNTSVLGFEFINQFFTFGNPGRASAVVTVLVLAVIPLVFYQVRAYRQQELLR